MMSGDGKDAPEKRSRTMQWTKGARCRRQGKGERNASIRRSASGEQKVQKQAADHHEADHQGGEAHRRPEQWSVQSKDGSMVSHVHAGR